MDRQAKKYKKNLGFKYVVKLNSEVLILLILI